MIPRKETAMRPGSRASRLPIAIALPTIALLLSALAGAGELRFPPGDAGIGPSVGTQVAPSVAAGANGYLVAWQDWRTTPFTAPPFASTLRGIDVYGRLLDADGAPVGLPFASPAVGFDGTRYMVVWSEGTQVRGKRLSSSTDAATGLRSPMIGD
jgi:hypothetical protein